MDTYYKCPHCNREFEEPGFCQHGAAKVALKQHHVVRNPVNSAPYVNGRLVGVHDGWFGRLATGETEIKPDEITRDCDDVGRKYDPLAIVVEDE